MEIVLPGIMTVMESHDIALALQHKIEGLASVERAFVHVRYSYRVMTVDDMIVINDNYMIGGSSTKRWVGA